MGQYYISMSDHCLWRFLEPLFLFSIVNMAPVCLLLPYVCNVCTLVNLNLNMNFPMIYFTKI